MKTNAKIAGLDISDFLGPQKKQLFEGQLCVQDSLFYFESNLNSCIDLFTFQTN